LSQARRDDDESYAFTLRMMRELLERWQIDDVALHVRASYRLMRDRTRWWWNRRFGAVDRRLVRDYLANHAVRKLQLGCGVHPLPGWLNADLWPATSDILHLNVARRFPFADEQIDFIFAEHVIEHLSYTEALVLLREAYRILRPGGVVRITTPDLAFLLRLYGDPTDDEAARYLAWTGAEYLEKGVPASACAVINNYVRAWGHRFIYDEPTLRSAMIDSGFTRLRRCELNESEVAELRGVENEARMPPGHLRLESMTVEAERPREPGRNVA
jgi:predicted SAM-dependent methyltransferase